MNAPIVGTCEDMCPVEERRLREKERLLHRLETDPDSTNKFTSDPLRTVKCFSRSAAGQATPSPKSLRPAPVLRRTVRYLVRDIAATSEISLDVLHFVTDRLRAVRQDMIIQQLPESVCLDLLIPMVRFHVFYGYKLSNNSRFDMHLNDKHLHECLFRILSYYRENIYGDSKHRLEMEYIFTCANLHRPEVVMSCLNLLNESSMHCLPILAAWSTQNFSRLLRKSERFPIVAKMAFARHLTEIRKNALFSMCHAFSSVNCSYPTKSLMQTLSYSCLDEVILDCSVLGIDCDEDRVKFSKKSLKGQCEQLPVHPWWVVDVECRSINLANILCTDD